MSSSQYLIKDQPISNNCPQRNIVDCIKGYLSHKKDQQTAPFPNQNQDSTNRNFKFGKYKRTLMDWRRLSSQRLSNSPLKSQKSVFVSQTQINKKSRNLNEQFDPPRQAKSSHMLTRPQNKTQRNMQSLSSKRKQTTRNQSPHHAFSTELTPFYLVQNLYETQVKNFETEKKALTVRIRSYYEKKAEKYQQFRAYANISSNSFFSDSSKNQSFSPSLFVRSKKLQTHHQSDSKSTYRWIFGNKRLKQAKRQIKTRKSKRILIPGEPYAQFNQVEIKPQHLIKSTQI